MLNEESLMCVCVYVCVLQAIWFTASQGLEGPVYGAADQWNGVGIFFDSFDNDGKVNAHECCYFFKNVIILFLEMHFILKLFMLCKAKEKLRDHFKF